LRRRSTVFLPDESNADDDHNHTIDYRSNDRWGPDGLLVEGSRHVVSRRLTEEKRERVREQIHQLSRIIIEEKQQEIEEKRKPDHGNHRVSYITRGENHGDVQHWRLATRLYLSNAE
jgi:hypothetical protein